jgi:hypothetical protein
MGHEKLPGNDLQGLSGQSHYPNVDQVSNFLFTESAKTLAKAQNGSTVKQSAMFSVPREYVSPYPSTSVERQELAPSSPYPSVSDKATLTHVHLDPVLVADSVRQQSPNAVQMHVSERLEGLNT